MYFSAHIPCWACSSTAQMAGLLAQDFHHVRKKKSIFPGFFPHFLQCKIFTPSVRIDGICDWHCTTAPDVSWIMSICVKGKAHSKIRSKVCALKASNGGQNSCFSARSTMPIELLRCHTTDNDWRRLLMCSSRVRRSGFHQSHLHSRQYLRD